jgi:hypothetical protein
MNRPTEIRSPAQVERLRSLARFLDSALPVPGTRYRFGLDAVIGLIPGIGDAFGALFSVIIVFQAARLGAPRSTLIRMMGNIALDTIVGGIPLLGDLFDVGWQSNNRNLALLEQHLNNPAAALRSSRRMLLLVTAMLLLILAVVIGLTIWAANLTVIRMS